MNANEKENQNRQAQQLGEQAVADASKKTSSVAKASAVGLTFWQAELAPISRIPGSNSNKQLSHWQAEMCPGVLRR